jgi:hypothetical protein
MRRLQNGNRVKLALTASFLCAVAIATLGSPAALAVDTSSNDAPDLSAVRSNIKAKDYQGASVDLRALADTNPHADVYSLMGFSLRASPWSDNSSTLTVCAQQLISAWNPSPASSNGRGCSLTCPTTRLSA